MNVRFGVYCNLQPQVPIYTYYIQFVLHVDERKAVYYSVHIKRTYAITKLHCV